MAEQKVHGEEGKIRGDPTASADETMARPLSAGNSMSTVVEFWNARSAGSRRFRRTVDERECITHPFNAFDRLAAITIVLKRF
jgi:hypothetical protein